MFSSIRHFLDTWKQLKAFQALPEEYRQLVIYSEGLQDWPHIGPMVEKFFELNAEKNISYLSSGENDPGLHFKNERFKAFYIGSGTARTLFFKTLQCKLLMMSLPDLEIYHLKRSAVYPVHYVYCFHSISSTHTVYRERALEFYDTFLCVGRHHLEELRKEEALKGMKPRRLLEHGSVKLDTVIQNYAHLKNAQTNRETPLILLAPSWGTGSFAENHELVSAMIRNIAEKSWECRLRFHPMTLRHQPKLAQILLDQFKSYADSGLFQVETNLNDNTSLRDAAVMVSDWSGAATEFAFALEKPVLFIDTPQKINNPKWEDYGMPGLEARIRTEIGSVLHPERINEIVPCLEDLMTEREKYHENIIRARESLIFNIGKSAEVGAKLLSDLLEGRSLQEGKLS